MVEKRFTGTTNIVLSNLRKWVVPVITSDADLRFAFDGKSISVSSGTFIIPDLVLKQGNNEITCTKSGSGYATVKFEYQEGEL